MYGNAEVSDNASVSNGAKVFGNALICGDARLYGYPVVSGNACVCGDVSVQGAVNITGDAELFEPWHILAIDLISTEDAIVTFARPKPGTPHAVTIGDWYGLLDDMSEEAERRSKNWKGTHKEKKHWREEYELAEQLCRTRLHMWE